MSIFATLKVTNTAEMKFTLKTLPLRLFGILLFQVLAIGSLSAGNQHTTQLLDSLQKIMKKHQIPGMMLTLVDRDSVIFSGGLGYSDVEKKEKVTSNHVFRLGSVTKTFTALAILQLTQQKKFSLDDPLSRIAPELPIVNPWEATHPVKVIHLLEHSAGFDDMHFNAVYRKDTFPISHLTAVNKHSKSLECRWKPGLMSSYSNPGYVVLGYLIEKYSGMPYEQYVSENILLPIGMQNAHFSVPHRFQDLHASGYMIQPKGGAKKAEFYQIYGNAAGGLCASSQDMSKFLQVILNNGVKENQTLLDSVTLINMRFAESTLSARSGLEGGYGKAMYRSMLSANRSFFGHSGGIEGFISYYGFQPDMGKGYAFSINSMSSVRELSKVLADYLTSDEERIQFAPTAMSQTERDDFGEFVGYYSVANPRNQLLSIADYLFKGVDLNFVQDTIKLKPLFKNPEVYLYDGHGAFVLQGQTLPSLYLLKDEYGNRWIEGDSFFTPDSVFFARFWLVVLASGFILGMVLAPFGLVWCIMLATKGLDWKEFNIRISPVVALASFMGLLFTFSVISGDAISAGEINLVTLSITLLSLTFFVFGNYSLYQQIRNFKRKVHWGIPLLTIPASLAYMLFSWFMLYHGLIGVMVWRY